LNLVGSAVLAVASLAVAVLDMARLALLLAAAGTAGDQHDNGGDQGQDSDNKGEPSGRAIAGITGAVVVDLVAQEGEGDEVDDESDGVDDEGGGGDEHGQDGDDGAAGGKGEEEGDEESGSTDGVEDQDAGQGLDGIATGIAEVNGADILDDLGRVVANGRIRARPAGKQFVSKRTKSSGGMIRRPNSLSVRRPGAVTENTKLGITLRQVEADKGNSVGDGGGNAHHDGEDHGDEEEGRAQVVNSLADTHDEEVVAY
jgi:hypothetical protein